MKTSALLLLFPFYLFSQVGIGTDSPAPSAILELSSTDKAFLLPRLDVLAVTEPVNGMMIYDINAECIKVYANNTWMELNTCTGASFSADCNSNGFEGSYIAGNALSSNEKFTVTITNTTSSNLELTFNSGDLTLSGVSGISVSQVSPSELTTIGVGLSQVVEYTLIGTPSSSGMLNAEWAFNGVSCSNNVSISENSPMASLPVGMTFDNADNIISFIPSVNDQDYLPYTFPTAAAEIPAESLAEAADGNLETETIDYQGVIGVISSGNEISIPLEYTATSAGLNYDAYNQTVSIPITLQEGGTEAVDLTFSYPAGTTSGTSGTVMATISAASTLNVVKLDLNTGIGNDALGILLTEFQIPIDETGSQGNVSIRITPGMLDQQFVDVNNRYVYLPITAEDGNVWLNNNLGANYANLSHSSFNPSQQATGFTDSNAYGSIYQWGRQTDGHELISCSTATNCTVTGTLLTGTSSSASYDNVTNGNTTPNNNTIYFPNNTNDNWLISNDSTLWQGIDGPNNPCPSGFRVPTRTEWENLLTQIDAAYGIGADSEDSVLKFTRLGHKSSSGNNDLFNEGTTGRYWTSTENHLSNKDLASNYVTGNENFEIVDKKNLRAVRCIQD